VQTDSINIITEHEKESIQFLNDLA